MNRSCFALVPLVLLAAASARAQDTTTAPTTTPPVTTTKSGVVETNSLGPPTASATAPMKQGFALELHMYAQPLNVATATGVLTAPFVYGGIFGGYKIDRIIVGVGFDFTSSDAGGGAQIVMRWAPGLRVAIVRSNDERVELFGQFDFSFGHDFGSNVGNELIGVDLGPGVRYWVHPQFALSAVGGWNGNWNLYDGVGPLPGQKSVVMGIFAGLQLLGIF